MMMGIVVTRLLMSEKRSRSAKDNGKGFADSGPSRFSPAEYFRNDLLSLLRIFWLSLPANGCRCCRCRCRRRCCCSDDDDDDDERNEELGASSGVVGVNATAVKAISITDTSVDIMVPTTFSQIEIKQKWTTQEQKQNKKQNNRSHDWQNRHQNQGTSNWKKYFYWLFCWCLRDRWQKWSVGVRNVRMMLLPQFRHPITPYRPMFIPY